MQLTYGDTFFLQSHLQPGPETDLAHVEKDTHVAFDTDRFADPLGYGCHDIPSGSLGDR